MKIWRKESTKPIKNEKAEEQEEFTDISQTSTPVVDDSKKDKMEEIYSTKDKQIKYKRLTPLEAEEAAKRTQSAKEKLTSGKAEIALNTPVSTNEIVELTSEHEEGTVIAEDIIEDVEDIVAPRTVHVQDIDEIDIDIDHHKSLKKYELQAKDTSRYEKRNTISAKSEYERIFGKPKYDVTGEKIVAKIPTYQHDSKITLINLKAGRFTDVVESEYDEYLKSNDPIISKRPEHLGRNIEPKQSLLYTLSQLAQQKNSEQKSQPSAKAEKIGDKPLKKHENKIKKFFRILAILLLPKAESGSNDTTQTVQSADYQSRQDAKYVSKEIATNLKNLIVKTGVLSVLFVMAFVLTVMQKVSGADIFLGTPFAPLIYCGVNLLILIITGVIAQSFIISGLKPLKKFKGNSDTAVACAYIACLIQQIASMFTSLKFVDSTLHLYTTIITFSFVMNTLGRALMASRVKSNFKFITSKSPAFAAKIFNDEETARKMLSGTTASHSVVAYQHPTRFLSDFLKISYAPDPSEELCSKLTPITLVSSVFVAVTYGVISKTFIGALSALAVMLCISIPVCALLCGNLPLKFSCKDTLKHGAMLSGYPSIRQFCDCDAVMVDAMELYPKGSIKLNAMKHFAEFRVEESLLSAAVILKEAKSPLYTAFEKILEENAHNLPKVESVMYEDKLGLVGWVGGERVLIGNRKLLDRYHIYLDDAADETKYKNSSKDVTYIACSGQLVSMIVTTYTPNPVVKNVLSRAQKNGLCLVVRTTDCNVTQDKIATDYEIYARTVKVLSTGYASTCNEVSSKKEESSRSYLATRGKFSSLLYAVNTAISLKHNLTIGIIIEIFGLILGVLLCATMVLYASVSILGVLEMLLYMLFWSIATIVVQFVKR
ncbi:MAG: hypothetical protein E7513_03220 [Ruminococcaceae bacterium]|nr:hypothetical protein [Oscillospiraceae bacterium]